MKFEITESEAIRLTGYSRQHLRQMRQGRKQVQNGKEYATEPTLERGADYEIRFACDSDYESNKNGRVFYSDECVKKLKKLKKRKSTQASCTGKANRSSGSPLRKSFTCLIVQTIPGFFGLNTLS